MDEFEFAIKEGGVWLMFEEEPNLESINKARQLLNQLTDQILMEKLNVPVSPK